MCSVGNLQVEPSWRNKDQFIRDHLQDVFMLDALESSHPISVPVEHTDQIREIFDGVSYSKSMFLWIVSVKKRTVEERCCSITLIWHIFMLLSLGES
jgi:Aminopeptidase N